MRKLWLLLLVATCAWAQSPVITNITNAAIPSLDNPPATLHLPARAMATIYGTNLADFAFSANDGWLNSLGGTEVHLAADNCADASCDLVAQLIYVSPTQINFVVPANGATQSTAYRIVLIRDGVRVDNPNYLKDGPGRLVIDSPLSGTDLNEYNLVFQVGYDCLYSLSQVNPAICGVSNDAGPNRAPLGAITDAYGHLISSANPAHQGQILTLWMTALRGNLVANPQNGLLEQTSTTPVSFGVADSGVDITTTLSLDGKSTSGSFQTPKPLWAGEAPGIIGLDQVNIAFPTCNDTTTATREDHYDAFLLYTSLVTGNSYRVYVPFQVRVGDPDCSWRLNTNTIVSTDAHFPMTPGTTATLTATVTPDRPWPMSGSVSFYDLGQLIGTADVQAGANPAQATLTHIFTKGDHSITASYNGDANCWQSSSAALLISVTGLSTTTTSVNASINPADFGDPVTFVAHVFPQNATGTINVIDNGRNLCTAAISYGTATCTVTDLTMGHHMITASYGGDGNNATSVSQGYSLMVQQAAPLTLSATPNPSSMGQYVGLTLCNIPANFTFVAFLDAGTVLNVTNTYNDGACVRGGTSSLKAGVHALSAQVSDGDGTVLAASVSLLVNKLVTSTIVLSSLSPATAEQSVTFTAAVTPTDASGTITFADGAVTLGSAPLIGGKAAFSTSSLTAGNHTIAATYSGDATYASSTGSVAQVINPKERTATTTAISTDVNPSLVGQTVTFSVTITGPTTAAGGSVLFFDGTTLLGGDTVHSGNVASYSTNNLAAGSHVIRAYYAGDVNYLESAGTVTQVVNLKLTTVTVTSSNNPSFSGDTVTFTASVTGPATGNIAFTDGGDVFIAALTNGKAVYTTSSFTAGTHTITAAYNGDSTYAASSGSITQTVNKITPAITLISSLNPADHGQSVTFTARVVSPRAVPAVTGTITFLDGTTQLATAVALVNGTATFTLNTLGAGTHSITAAYGGDAHYGALTSTVLTQTVKTPVTVRLVSSLNPAMEGQSVTFTATIVTPSAIAPVPTGSITFGDGSTTTTVNLTAGAATYTPSSLAAGTYAMTASYSGDAVYAVSTSPSLTQTVKPKGATSLKLNVDANPSHFGKTVTFTAIVTGPAAIPPVTGTVTFTDGSTVLGSATIAASRATFSTSSLTAGTHQITATYDGNANYATSSNTIAEVVLKQTAVTLTASANPVTFGQPLTLTARIVGSSAILNPLPTGTVTFTEGTDTLGTTPLASGTAAFDGSSLAVGSHLIVATYSGDSAYDGSVSAVLTVTINDASPPTITDVAAQRGGSRK